MTRIRKRKTSLGYDTKCQEPVSQENQKPNEVCSSFHQEPLPLPALNMERVNSSYITAGKDGPRERTYLRRLKAFEAEASIQQIES